MQHLRDVVDAGRIDRGHDGFLVDVAHERDLALDPRGQRTVRPQPDGIGLNADAAQLCHRVLRGLGLELTRGPDVGKQGHVEEKDIVSAHLVADLAHRFEEGQGLDIAHCAAHLGDDDIDIRPGHASDA